MNLKFLELRDSGTTIPVLAIEISSADGWLASHAGFGSQPCIYLIVLSTQVCSYDPYEWGNKVMGRTVKEAHHYIVKNWELIENEDVIDVEFILGEKDTKKESERFYHWSN